MGTYLRINLRATRSVAGDMPFPWQGDRLERSLPIWRSCSFRRASVASRSASQCLRSPGEIALVAATVFAVAVLVLGKVDLMLCHEMGFLI